jgi:hypothetical protein
MRLFSLILAVIVLFLNTFTCTDGLEHVRENSVEFSNCNHQSSHEEHKDTCSPFCQCACCAVTCIVYDNLVFHPHYIAIFPSELVSLSRDESLLDISLPIWQPPQLLHV